MIKILKFETLYKKVKNYTIHRKCKSPHIKDHNIFWRNRDKEFERFFYQSFRLELQHILKFNPDQNAWVFDQNELNTKYTGKLSLKQLCLQYYNNQEI